MIAGLLAAASIAAATPAPAATQNVSWNGIVLGAPSAPLRSTLGDPLHVTQGKYTDAARYWIPGSKASYFLVLEENGHVAGFMGFDESGTAPEGVPADPSGVTIGDTVDAVKAKHPDFQLSQDPQKTPTLSGRVGDVDVTYDVANGHVTDFEWSRPFEPSSVPALPSIADPAGDSYATAILDAQNDEMSGVSWEYRYLAFHPCSGDERWKLKMQSLRNSGGKAYDVLHVVCPSTNAERDFFFDITRYFGKP
jgi:hypothetical protein